MQNFSYLPDFFLYPDLPELKYLKSGMHIDVAETPVREHAVDVIAAIKKKISKRILKAVTAVCLVFAALFGAVLLYTGIGHPVTKDNISLSTKTDGYTLFSSSFSSNLSCIIFLARW